MAVALELALNNTTQPSGRYVGWAPAPASLRVLDSDGAASAIGVSLDSPGPAGRVVLAAERSAEAADQTSLELPVDGTPVDFWVLGRFQHRAAPTEMPGSPFDRPPETSPCSPFHSWSGSAKTRRR